MGREKSSLSLSTIFFSPNFHCRKSHYTPEQSRKMETSSGRDYCHADWLTSYGLLVSVSTDCASQKHLSILKYCSTTREVMLQGYKWTSSTLVLSISLFQKKIGLRILCASMTLLKLCLSCSKKSCHHSIHLLHIQKTPLLLTQLQEEIILISIFWQAVSPNHQLRSHKPSRIPLQVNHGIWHVGNTATNDPAQPRKENTPITPIKQALLTTATYPLPF